MAAGEHIERIERIAISATDGLRETLRRLASLVGVVVVITAGIGAATFVTGMWVFDGSIGWIVLGGAITMVPVGAAIIAWFFVRGAARAAPRLLDDARTFLRTTANASGLLIDHDSGVALGMQAKSMGGLRRELLDRRRELPALFMGVRAITSVPGLAAIAVLGTIGVGLLGTILLIGGAIG
jgi:hypothetical protein